MAAFSLNFSPVSISIRSTKLVVQCSSSPPSSSSQIVNGGVKPIVITGDPPTFVSAPGRRIVAVGDLHGDLSQTRNALEIAGILRPNGFDWIGGDTVLVQLGDILDRGEDEIAILSLLKSLKIQAKSKGGAVFQVNGNHETMNVEGDFRYVDPNAFDECINFLNYFEECNGNWNDAFLSWILVSREMKGSPGNWSPWLIKRQKGVSARSALLSPGGALACELAKNPVVIKINDWIFCHGGLLPHHVMHGLERMNKEVSDWMRDPKQQTPIPFIGRRMGTVFGVWGPTSNPRILLMYGVERMNKEVSDWMRDSKRETPIPFIATRGYDSVVWNRLYSREPGPPNTQSWKISSVAEKTLEGIRAKGMVVGHTPQIDGANCSKYDDRVWCIDVGMSSGVLNSSPEVLEIVNNRARVLKSGSDFLDGIEIVDYI